MPLYSLAACINNDIYVFTFFFVALFMYDVIYLLSSWYLYFIVWVIVGLAYELWTKLWFMLLMLLNMVIYVSGVCPIGPTLFWPLKAIVFCLVDDVQHDCEIM